MADEIEYIVRAFSELMAKQAEEPNARMLEMLRTLQATSSIPKFEAFSPERELFKDHVKRFETFVLVSKVIQRQHMFS